MSAATVEAGLLAVLTTALVADAAVEVVIGPPGPTVMPDVVALTEVRADTDGEEQTFEIDVIVSCYVGGGAEAQATADARAYTLLDTIAAAIYASPTLGGTARQAALGPEHRIAKAVGYDVTGAVPVGRLAEIRATVTAWSARPLLGSLAAAHQVP